MKILVLNGSPRRNGTVASLLKSVTESLPTGHDIEGKSAVVVTACTTPWPFNFILPESRGAIRSVKEVLHYGGYKTVGTITKAGTKKSTEISTSLMKKAKRLGEKLILI